MAKQNRVEDSTTLRRRVYIPGVTETHDAPLSRGNSPRTARDHVPALEKRLSTTCAPYGQVGASKPVVGRDSPGQLVSSNVDGPALSAAMVRYGLIQ